MEPKDLIGKTIQSAVYLKKPQFDDEAWMKLTFIDGSSCMVIGTYGSYSGESEDEYPAYVYLMETDRDYFKDLIPVEAAD